MGEPALIFDEKFSVVWANPAAEVFFGHSTEYMNGMKCTQLFSEHMECMSKCPVQKALETGTEQILAVDGISMLHKLIEAVPFGSSEKLLILSIIHSPPENHRTRALRRDLGAALNRCATLEEASDIVLDAIGVLAFVNRRGIYLLSGNKFDLTRGFGVPESFPSGVLDECPAGEIAYLSPDEINLDEGAALFPVNGKVVLLAGRGSWGPTSRSMLEMVGEVVQDCIHRLTSGAFSKQ